MHNQNSNHLPYRRTFLKILGLGAAALALPRGSLSCKSTKKKPNVVLVITDDQGYGDLACHGNPVIQTPNLDRLYEQSVRLTNFHVGPTCAPTRAALMTGRYCNRTGVWHTIMGRSLLRQDEVTVADVFRANGYKTGIFGKWHLGDNYPFRPQDRGFDEVMIHGGGGVGQTPDYWDNDYFNDIYFHNGEWTQFNGYCTDIWFNGAMQFIEANNNRPFFCYLTTNAPHGPFNVDEKYSQTYEDKGLPEQRARFYGMITNIDENMARLEMKLQSLGLKDNTIFIYMTDNGTAAGVDVDDRGFVIDDGYNAGMRGRKGSPYDGGHRVPCFIRWPGGRLQGGMDIDRITAHIDLMPTLMDLCGFERREGLNLDGDSLAPLLRGEDWKDRILITDSQRIENPEKWRRSAVMTDRWRLINGSELYDMKTDPGQKNDVSVVQGQEVRKLRDAYEEWWADVSKRFNEYCHVIVGSDRENPVRLTAHDWHTDSLPWNQRQIRNGLLANGFWVVEIVRSGDYEFSLCRWPRELNRPITAGIPSKKGVAGVEDLQEGKALQIISARLKIADIDLSKPVNKNDNDVAFRTELKKGKKRLQTWFATADDETLGAYYVYIRRLG